MPFRLTITEFRFLSVGLLLLLTVVGLVRVESAAGMDPTARSTPRGTHRAPSVPSAPLTAAVQPGKELPQSTPTGTLAAQPSAATQDSPKTFAQLPVETQQGIAAAMRAAQAIPDSTDLFFTNPSQSLSAVIGGSGSTVRGRDGAAVRFSHPELGRSDQFVAMTDARPNGVTTPRITIERQAAGIAVSEWWHNSTAGVEQGFTVSARPAGTGALEVRQRWDSALCAEVSTDGGALILSDRSGERLRYAGLKAWDATGRTLPAQLQVSGHTLAMVVDDVAAVYPIVIDPTWAQQAYLKASNTEAMDNFGYSVAIAGDTIVVGADGEDSNGTGVNGGAQANNSASSDGIRFFEPLGELVGVMS